MFNFQPIQMSKKSMLATPVSIPDIEEAIKNMKSGKALNLYGYPAEWYKALSDEIASVLINWLMTLV